MNEGNRVTAWQSNRVAVQSREEAIDDGHVAFVTFLCSLSEAPSTSRRLLKRMLRPLLLLIYLQCSKFNAIGSSTKSRHELCHQDATSATIQERQDFQICSAHGKGLDVTMRNAE